MMRIFEIFVVGAVAKLTDEIHSKFEAIFQGEKVRSEFEMVSSMTAFYAEHKSHLIEAKGKFDLMICY